MSKVTSKASKSAPQKKVKKQEINPASGILDQINLIAESLVLLAPDDMPSLAALHDLFLGLETALKEYDAILPDVAKKCGNLIEKIILREVSSVNETVDVLNESVTNLQSLVQGERRVDQVQFPSQLGLLPKIGEQLENKREEALEAVSETASQPPQSSHPELQSFNPAIADPGLLGEFISEASDHCQTAEQMMMELETGSDYAGKINAIFRSFHSIKGAAGFLDLKPIMTVAHESETMLDQVRNGRLKIDSQVADTIFASIDALRKLLSATEQGLKTGKPVEIDSAIAGLLARIRHITESGNGAIDPPGGESPDIARSTEAVPSQSTPSANEFIPTRSVAQEGTSKSPGSDGARVKEMVKIDTERLDRLVDTIGELIIAESMVGHDEEFLRIAPSRIAKNVTHLNKITRELQEMGMAMRLVPVRGTFQKLARAVRDLSRKSGKQVELTMSGEDSEVDRSIVEHIGDPLMHMIRNAADHGIESPEERRSLGKSEVGHVWLRAFHRGGSIHFEIEDDGRGLDRERILAKALEKGLIDGSRELSDREVFQLVLLPGFSTAEKVTDISGRGVGMDVVKKNIEALRGHLEIESVRHKGSKFTMKLPLTLAMIDGMLVRVGAERYIVPTISVVETVNLATEKIFTVNGNREIINLRGSLLPIIRLAELFALQRSGWQGVIIIAEDNDKRVGLVVDELVGQRQTVIKSLGPVFSRQKWVSGGALLSDGTVGLILDISGIVGLAETSGYQANQSNSIEEDMSLNPGPGDSIEAEMSSNHMFTGENLPEEVGSI